MNLSEIRVLFRDLSGRYDLVDADGDDLGADFYIREGSKWLDRSVDTMKAFGTYTAIIDANSWYVSFPLSRAIKEVWLSTRVGKFQLTKMRLQDMLASYYTRQLPLSPDGMPRKYSVALTRPLPEGEIDPGDFTDFIEIIPPDSHEYNAVVFSGRVNVESLIEVVGTFYSKPLEEDEDDNFWSQVHPMLLIQAAIRQTFVVSGNRVMLKTFEENLDRELMNIEKDFVDQEISEIDQMKG